MNKIDVVWTVLPAAVTIQNILYPLITPPLPSGTLITLVPTYTCHNRHCGPSPFVYPPFSRPPFEYQDTIRRFPAAECKYPPPVEKELEQAIVQLPVIIQPTFVLAGSICASTIVEEQKGGHWDLQLLYTCCLWSRQGRQEGKRSHAPALCNETPPLFPHPAQPNAAFRYRYMCPLGSNTHRAPDCTEEKNPAKKPHLHQLQLLSHCESPS